MVNTNEIRADYSTQSIVIYQAYPSAIAHAVLRAQQFVSPFSFTRMTWIKPSFLWLMERSNWGQKAGQEYILAVHMTRHGWEEALSLGVLTSYEPSAHATMQLWRNQFEQAVVHVQWDPERSLRGRDVGYNSIQVGLSRHIIQTYVTQWVTAIHDYTPTVRKIHALLKAGQTDKAKRLVPSEQAYPVNSEVAKHLHIHF